MDIQVLGSGSKGNAYLAMLPERGGVTLLLDCGLTWGTMQKKFGYLLSVADACLITHEHGDHAKGVQAVMQNGINVYTSRGTAEALGIADHHRCHIVEPNAVFNVGPSVQVKTLPVEHDAAQPFAYLIRDTAYDEMLLFATDLQYLPYNIPGLTHAMVEANYEYDNMSLDDSDLNRRVMKSHMSIDALEEWLLTGDAKNTLEEIWLLHLSDDRSNEAEFKRRIQQATGALVHVA